MLAAFGQTFFAAERVLPINRAQFRELCVRLGGIAEVLIVMRECNLFLGRLQGSSLLLSLVVRHGKKSAAVSETMVHARAIRSRLPLRKKADMESEVQQYAARTESSWKSPISAVTARSTKSSPSPAPCKAASTHMLRQAIAGDLFDLATGVRLEHYRHPRLGEPQIPDAGAMTKALFEFFGNRRDVRSSMKTEMYPFPHVQMEFHGIIDRLVALPKDDLVSRLNIGGFATFPVQIDGVTQRCQECIYYLPHRKWCDLPALPVPVETGWWCRLWKI